MKARVGGEVWPERANLAKFGDCTDYSGRKRRNCMRRSRSCAIDMRSSRQIC